MLDAHDIHFFRFFGAAAFATSRLFLSSFECIFNLFLSLSLSHTHTHTHTLMLTRTHSLTHMVTLGLVLFSIKTSRSLPLKLNHSLSHSLSLSHTHTCAHTRSHTHILPLFRTRTRTHATSCEDIMWQDVTDVPFVAYDRYCSTSRKKFLLGTKTLLLRTKIFAT